MQHMQEVIGQYMMESDQEGKLFRAWIDELEGRYAAYEERLDAQSCRIRELEARYRELLRAVLKIDPAADILPF